ncbi:LCP family protein [Oscillochloris sp. ZM17-4]|uniref:LCP family protein n=1 Tax=Oscillochloris sp. ZM17-4 TaxID=2866714 RepID=UPI001C731FE3|nr:LCP family protein [Oscillochloris sp. ZM17-4]MBX0329855.1 LCP family protein [Oscillochloris sp. ZM17-4]
MSIGCDEARRLIKAGVRPGAKSQQQVALGFHLTGCAPCRAAIERENMALLGDLLGAPPAALAGPSPAPRPTLRRPGLRAVLLALLALLALLVGVSFGRVAYAAYTIRQNVAAMQITAPTGPTSTPALRVPAVAAVATPGAVEMPRQGGSTGTAAGPTAATGAEPPPPAPSAAPTIAGAPVGFVPSPTPIMLPSVVGGAPPRLPTLMPTAPVAPVSGRALNILLLGSDRRPGESWTTRSDAVVVLHLDPERQRVAMLSLPRDLIVPIPGYGQARINAATVYGDLYPALGGGVELARRTVGEYLGIPITYVLRTDFHAFTAAVDAIGGVDIDVPEALYDPAYPTMDYGYMVASFAPGPQHMDGETALIYARIRHMDSTYARNRRQQQVLLSILDQVRQRDILTQVQMISDLTAALRDDIQTDMSPEQMLGLAWAFRGVSPDAVERYALDETMVSEGVLADDPYATFADQGAVKALARQLVNGPASPTGP